VTGLKRLIWLAPTQAAVGAACNHGLSMLAPDIIGAPVDPDLQLIVHQPPSFNTTTAPILIVTPICLEHFLNMASGYSASVCTMTGVIALWSRGIPRVC
jgi:hypothetical protein